MKAGPIRGYHIAAALLGGIVASAGEAGAQVERYRDVVDTVVTLDSRGSVNVSVFSGRVSVVGGSGSRVTVRGRAEQGRLRFDAGVGGVRIRAEPEGRRGGNAELTLTVPVGTRVILESHSAQLSVAGVRGAVTAESLSGAISVRDAVGKVNAESVSGSLNISGVSGDVRAESVSGSVLLSGVSGDIDGESVSGHIEVTGARSRSVRAESVSGRVGYAGTLDAAGTYRFTSHSGTLRLLLPPDAGAMVSLETFSGHVESDFPVTLPSGMRSGRHGDNRFELRLGDGRARIIAETFSGNIRIQRGTGRPRE